jgi:sarcosine oxidase subunit gamma
MADARKLRHGPLDGFATHTDTGSLTVLMPMTRLIYRGRISTIGRVAAAFGVEPAMQACRAAAAGSRAALWLGPDEWLLLARDGDGPAIVKVLEAALIPLPHSLVDISHRQLGLKLAGERAAPILNAGCPLDLDIQAFPVGMCTRTLLEKAEIVLWRTAETAFQIEVARSLAPYVSRFLEQAEHDL